jgi:hypothetical protein
MKERTMRVTMVVFVCFLTLSGLANAQTDFCIQSIQRNPDETITLTWPALAGRTYHVMSADAIDGLWQDIPDGQLTAGTNDLTLCYTDTFAPVTSQRFYKVRRDRPQLVMTLVLDRSGSMDPRRGPLPIGDGSGSGGGRYLAPAVTYFINHFDDNTDRAAVASFAWTASVDVAMQRPFKNAIANAVTNLTFNGATFIQGGLTNALVQNQSVIPGLGESMLKVVVLFTDGTANVVQDTLNCAGIPTLRCFGGYDVMDTVGCFDPISGTEMAGTAGGGELQCCPGVSGLTTAIDGSFKAFHRSLVTADGLYRTIQVANDMRSAGMYVYTIGLGSGVNMTFLEQVANDPNSPTFNPAQPVGLAVVANDPSQLQAVFDQIALQILAH